MFKSIALACALLCTAVSASAQDAAAPAPSNDPPIRKLNGNLVDIKGRGLYTYAGDKTPGVSSCMAQCRILWPPLKAEEGAVAKGPFTIAVRHDGSKQWALRGKPLYRWASDKKYGDAGGDGVTDVWRLVRIAPASPYTPKPAPATPKPTSTPN